MDLGIGHWVGLMTAEDAAILFDIDGTLIDSIYHDAIAWQRAFDRCHLPCPLWKIHRCIGLGGDRLPTHVGGERVEARFGDELCTRWREEYLRVRVEVYPLPGATDPVRKLAGA